MGEATKSIYKAITDHGGAKPSYTYTDSSSSTLKKAAEVFNMYGDNMTFKVLDMEQSPATQGYEPHSYDIIVGSNVLHATSSLQKMLESARHLLKPGGYLVLLEPTDNNPIRFTTIMGGLPDWWLGVHDGRKYTPTVTTGVWHSTLRKTGFGGIDTITPNMDNSSSAWPFSVMAAQAVDDQVLFLRRPLSSSSSYLFIDNLVILGTGNLESSRIAEEVSDNLARFCGNITILDRLPTEADALDLDPKSTFINLIDLDSPIFKTMTNDKMEGLKRLLELARHIMWITCGVHMGEEPYHAASLAFCRSLSNEATHVSMNTLDVSGIDDHLSKVISEQILRQCALEEWDSKQLLWSKEPETVLYNGKLLLPRILPNLKQNARLNACRRAIVKKVPVATSNFTIYSETAASLPRLVEDILPPEESKDDGKVVVMVEASTLMALNFIPDAFLFLAIGKITPIARPVITLSTTSSHTVSPIVSIRATDDDSAVDVDQLLIGITSELLAESLVQNLPSGSNILVHCSDKDRFFAGALSRRAAANGVHVNFSYDANDSKYPEPSWISLRARTSRHVMRRTLLPLRLTHFIDLTTRSYPDARSTSETRLNIEMALPSNCKLIDPSSLTQQHAFLPNSFDREALVDRLQDAVVSAKTAIYTAVNTSEERIKDIILQIGQVCDHSVSHHTTSVIHWPVDGEIGVEVRPMDSRKLFSKDKTYILFGLSGQVGQSLCEWMVSNGAGCVVLTSRRPNVDQRWLDSFQGMKATVKVLSVDITEKDSLDSVLRTIRTTCPPIAGIANGANVLSDAPFDGMSTDMMLRALGPKVDGSYNLDQAFYNENLDFFVLFSSISCVIGTSGQSNYVAANGYLNGLARQRRRRGLAASAFDIGLILGIGLAETAGQHVVDSLQKYGITPLSEPDLWLAFAESIEAGRANPKDKEPGAIPASVMTSGLRTITADESDIVWYDNPIFSHLIDTKGKDGSGDQSTSKASSLPIKDKIASAPNEEAAIKLLKGRPKIKYYNDKTLIEHD